jgi:carboxymethylenebutenolidase
VGTPPPQAPFTFTPLIGLSPDLSCPLLGLFGAEDRFPSPEQVAELDAELTRLGKVHEFHSYEGAGHGFFCVDRPSYRVEAALDGWARIWEWFGRHLSS